MFTRYTNGAEQEVNGVYRYANGAEQKAEAAYRYVNGAEQAVWIAAIYVLKDGVNLGIRSALGASGVYTPEYFGGNLVIKSGADYQSEAYIQLTENDSFIGKRVYVVTATNSSQISGLFISGNSTPFTMNGNTYTSPTLTKSTCTIIVNVSAYYTLKIKDIYIA